MATQPTGMTPIAELAKWLAGDVKGCPPEIVLQAAQEACGEFCKNTLLWRIEAEPIPVRTGVHTYATPAPANCLPELITEAAFKAPNQSTYRPLDPITEALLKAGAVGTPYHLGFFGHSAGTDWKGRTGTPRAFLHEFDPAFFRLVPIPTSVDNGGLVRVTVAVWPSIKAVEIPTFVYLRYEEALSSGTLARLYGMNGEFWSNPALAEQQWGAFEGAMGAVTNKVQKSFTKARLKVEPRERFA